tara:strand:+ start:51 stop:974 length:924 start_codon:yes stop_codon:yes gene_type:complete
MRARQRSKKSVFTFQQSITTCEYERALRLLFDSYKCDTKRLPECFDEYETRLDAMLRFVRIAYCEKLCSKLSKISCQQRRVCKKLRLLRQFMELSLTVQQARETAQDQARAKAYCKDKACCVACKTQHDLPLVADVTTHVNVLPDAQRGNTFCPICMEDLWSGGDNDVVRMPSCTHVMHRTCYERWRKTQLQAMDPACKQKTLHVSCAICRAKPVDLASVECDDDLNKQAISMRKFVRWTCTQGILCKRHHANPDATKMETCRDMLLHNHTFTCKLFTKFMAETGAAAQREEHETVKRLAIEQMLSK